MSDQDIDPIGLGRKVLTNPISYLVGAIILSATLFGIDKTMEDTEKAIGGIKSIFCGNSIEIAEMRQERRFRDIMYAFQLSYATETGKILKTDCEAQKYEQGERFGMTISAAVSAALDSCERKYNTVRVIIPTTEGVHHGFSP